MSKLDPTAFCWYRSETQLGLIHLGVETSEAEQTNLQGPHRVFQQAALIANTEVMLQAIELWQEIDLDLIPCEAPDNTTLHLSLQLQDSPDSNTNSSNANSTALVATKENQLQADESGVAESADESVVESAEAGEQRATAQGGNADSQVQSGANTNTNPPRIVMVFDCATLVQLKSLSQELQSVLSVTSSSVDLLVQLDQFSITAEELAVLEAGAVVVIPAAFQPEWDIVAISATPGVPLKFGGSVKQNDRSLQVQFVQHDENSANIPETALDGSGETSNGPVAVWCTQQCSVPIKELLGVNATSEATQPHSIDARELHIMQGESSIANGSLLSYGRGSVVAVSERLID